ncbi:MAG: cysteine desulfurase family protein, partial [Deltaproteobacteria bacterium]|nr:cysteine desulfurase family protein [Deltaproteobacteria bacterium]
RNSVCAAGLAVSLAWILRKGVATIRRGEVALTDLLLKGLSRIAGVKVYGPADSARRGSAVSFRVEGMDPAEVGMRLEKRSGVLVRAGLHCSPNGHRALGTFPEGTVRVSPGPFTTRREIATFLSALRTIRDPAAG